MNHRNLQLILILCATILAVPCASHAYTYTYSNGSLYDAHSAQTPPFELRSIFGPLSGSIRYDARMIHAAQIAQERAHRHSTARCWHSVKNALVDAKVIPTRPTTEYAKQAGVELQEKYGFTKIHVATPYDAPVGAVLVYGGRGAGHVEIRTATGFASDFLSPTPSPRPLLGVYVKRS
ncbi:MAG TPA: hypothetical protein VHY22_12040 [Chthoniobacteraceae bacterium]|jgi:hypothetical protein|nr:hypothetical protein [Chthoniobacteraceae bacterium]